MKTRTDAEHTEKMKKIQAAQAKKLATKTVEKGLVIVHTGNGKGKSSAAFGMLARALGHGMNAVVVQFVKSRSDTGEEAFFRRHPAVRWYVMGEGFTWETQDPARDAAAARAAWETARAALADPGVALVILDELTYAFKYHWLDLDLGIALFRDCVLLFV